MEEYLAAGQRVHRESWFRVVGALVVGLAVITLVLFLAFRFVQWIWNLAAV